MVKKKLYLLFSIVFLFACANNDETKLSDTNKEKNKDDRQIIKVSTLKVKAKKFKHFFEANGSVEAVKSAFISPETNGQIKKVHIKEGNRVKKGDLLITLNTNILENNIEEIKTALDLAKVIFKKQDELWKQKIGSEIQFLEAKNQKESLDRKLKTLESQLEKGKIKAPISGIVDVIFLKEGELAAVGMQLIQLVNLKEVYVNADISENYLANINKGDQVELKFPSYPELNQKAKIYRIGNMINPNNRTFKVQVKISNSQEKLKPNLLSIIKVNDFTSENSLSIPSEIIKKDLKGNFIYLKEKDNDGFFAKKIYVETGRSDNNNTIIEKGLKNNQEIIVDGYNLVKNGTKISF